MKRNPSRRMSHTHSSDTRHETLEDYTLRYAPHSFRKWSPGIVSITALGGIAYLADFSIGASIGVLYGTLNAILAIIFAAVLIFVTGLPLAYYGARYNIDLDLITRGAGFGYYGSVITSIIFASFTFIFFALEGSIMAQGLYFAFDIPLWLGYLITVIVVFPLVIYGMKALSKLQVWTTPLWLIMMFGPVIILIINRPGFIAQWLEYTGNNTYPGINIEAVIMGAGIVLALMGQIGEQVDYLRFMPAPIQGKRKNWWVAVVAAGPGWIILGALKQIIGVFLAVYALNKVSESLSIQPVHQFIEAFAVFLPMKIAIFLSVILVVISQVKINVNNAYSGSLAWTNAYTRMTHSYPGRLIFVIVNLGIALALMEANMFAILNKVLGFYSNCAIAWIVTVATDIVVNKYILGISPKMPEYRRGMLYNINPVGTVSFILSSIISILAYFGMLGNILSSYSPLIAFIIAFVMTPLMAVLTKGQYYLYKHDDGILSPRFDDEGTPSSVAYICLKCNHPYERPDVLYSKKHEGIICSLCKATEP